MFIIPFTAGQTSRRNDGIVSHDGRISGIVLLLSALVMLVERLLAGSSPEAERLSPVDILEMLSNVWTFLATVSCIAVAVYLSRNRNILSENRPWNICNKIKLRFLWGFTLARMAYDILKLALYIDCINRPSNEKVKQKIVSYSFRLIFSVIQTGFLTHFGQYVFTCNPAVYYAFLIICMGNISIFVKTFVQSYKEIQEDADNFTKYFDYSNYTCNEVSPINGVIQKITPLLEPCCLFCFW